VITFITIIHLIVCVLLTIVILMQASKGGGLSGAFGGQASMGAVFGGRGAGSFLSKATIVLATLFMLGSLTQGLMKRGSGGDQRSLIQQEAQRQGTNSAADLLPSMPGEPSMSPSATPPQTAAQGDTTKK
jgi:preprotein translocase subunit SecG